MDRHKRGAQASGAFVMSARKATRRPKAQSRKSRREPKAPSPGFPRNRPNTPAAQIQALITASEQGAFPRPYSDICSTRPDETIRNVRRIVDWMEFDMGGAVPNSAAWHRARGQASVLAMLSAALADAERQIATLWNAARDLAQGAS
jgi:hypothetical protein